mgnify:CR=1 FL=1
MYTTETLLSIKQNVIDELTLAKDGRFSSFPFIKHSLARKPLVKEHELFQMLIHKKPFKPTLTKKEFFVKKIKDETMKFNCEVFDTNMKKFKNFKEIWEKIGKENHFSTEDSFNFDFSFHNLIQDVDISGIHSDFRDNFFSHIEVIKSGCMKGNFHEKDHGKKVNDEIFVKKEMKYISVGCQTDKFMNKNEIKKDSLMRKKDRIYFMVSESQFSIVNK